MMVMAEHNQHQWENKAVLDQQVCIMKTFAPWTSIMISPVNKSLSLKLEHWLTESRKAASLIAKANNVYTDLETHHFT